MKKSIILAVLAFAVMGVSSFVSNDHEDMPFVVKSENVELTWTAYKMTSKFPVPGTFKEINIDGQASGKSKLEALDGLKFSIPVNSVFTQMNLRDTKLKNFFFGVMVETISIKGEIDVINSESGEVSLSMNGVTKKLPVSLKSEGNTVYLEAVMDVLDWNAQEALNSLSDACEDLHTGPDGETVTWSEVKIEVKTSF